MQEVFVVNRNDFHHQDKFNGREFSFPKGEKQLIPVVAAQHMFGFGLGDKTEALVRLGWANLPNDEGVDRLKKFVFTEGRVVEVPANEKALASAAAA